MTEEQKEEIEKVGPGRTLKARREELGLSLEEIAGKVHLKPSQLEELESDQYDHALSITFTKGYIRLYAKYLELEPESMVALFDEYTNIEKQPTNLKSFSQKVAKQASDARLMMLTYFILLVVVGLSVVWWLQQDNGETPPINYSPVESVAAELSAEMKEAANNQAANNQATNNQVSNNQVSNNQPAPEDEAEASLNHQSVGSLSNNGTSVENETTDTVDNNGSIAETADTNTNDVSGVESADNPTLAEESIRSDSVVERDSNTGNAVVGNSSNSGEVNPISDNPANPQDTVEVSREVFSDTLTNSNLDSDPVAGDENQPVVTESEVDSQGDNGVFEPAVANLVFTFSDDCWMNLTDATGEVVAYGVKASGYVMPVSGIPPFEVVLGAPQAVSITVNGEEVDMTPYPAGRTARFSIEVVE